MLRSFVLLAVEFSVAAAAELRLCCGASCCWRWTRVLRLRLALDGVLVLVAQCCGGRWLRWLRSSPRQEGECCSKLRQRVERLMPGGRRVGRMRQSSALDSARFERRSSNSSCVAPVERASAQPAAARRGRRSPPAAADRTAQPTFGRHLAGRRRSNQATFGCQPILASGGGMAKSQRNFRPEPSGVISSFRRKIIYFPSKSPSCCRNEARPDGKNTFLLSKLITIISAIPRK